MSRRSPKSALKRYAELILRRVYQCRGRNRYVPIAEIEDALGLEQALILHLCRTRLLTELHVADRPRAELEESLECRTPLERHIIREYDAEPHVRVRPDAVRLTEHELLKRSRRR